MKKRIFAPFFLLIMATVAAEGSDALLARLVSGTNLVYDFAGVFQPAQKAELENYLRSVEQKTTAEIAVVALRSLEGGEINDFANRLFARWGIGKKDKDNGLLLLAAIEDRKVRIEVGYGLEGALPDAKTGRILDDHVIPEFKQQKYAEGLMAGAVALAEVVAREAGVEMGEPAEIQHPSTGQNPVVGLLVFGIFAGLIAFLAVAAKKGWIKSTGASTGSRSGGGFSGGSRGGSSFGGGSSGGGGASRGW